MKKKVSKKSNKVVSKTTSKPKTLSDIINDLDKAIVITRGYLDQLQTQINDVKFLIDSKISDISTIVDNKF